MVYFRLWHVVDQRSVWVGILGLRPNRKIQWVYILVVHWKTMDIASMLVRVFRSSIISVGIGFQATDVVTSVIELMITLGSLPLADRLFRRYYVGMVTTTPTPRWLRVIALLNKQEGRYTFSARCHDCGEMHDNYALYVCLPGQMVATIDWHDCDGAHCCGCHIDQGPTTYYSTEFSDPDAVDAKIQEWLEWTGLEP